MSFQARLKRVMDGGNLRIADLARLFDRRHSTVRGWVLDGREPAGTPAEIRELFAVVVKIEDAIKKKQVGAHLSKTQRAMALAEMQ
jgi:hypothetical protein